MCSVIACVNKSDHAVFVNRSFLEREKLCAVIVVLSVQTVVYTVDVIITVVCPNVYVYNTYSCNTYK